MGLLARRSLASTRTSSPQARLLLMPKFEPQPFLSALQQHRVSAAFIVPPVALFLAKHHAVDEYDLSALRFVLCAAAPLDARTQSDLSARLGIPVRQGWGMSELSPIGTLAPTLSPPVLGSVGVAVPNTTLKVADPRSPPLPNTPCPLKAPIHTDTP